MTPTGRQTTRREKEETQTKLVKLCDKIKALVPTTSNTITVENRKTVHKVIEDILRTATVFEGLVKDLRSELRAKERDNDILKAENAIAKAKTTTSAGNVYNTGPPLRSYARAVKHQTYDVLVQSEEGNISSEATKSLLQNKINPAEAKFEVVKVGKAKGTIPARVPELRSETVKKNKPRVILPWVEADTEQERVIEQLTANAEISAAYGTKEQLKKDINIRPQFKVRGNSNFKNIVAEVSPKLRKILLSTQVYINWQRVRVRDFISVLQCYQCYDFGHKSKDCKLGQVCGYCAGNHEYRECRSNRKCCIVCVRANKKSTGEKVKEDHDTKSPNCPTTKRINKAIENSIEYDE
ncbi:hypothetical protein CBL_12118 [Carabus blaptoides fortunei]